ncbi:hypothetical protein N0V93_003052 [Gnomoniopsis smithogilvyi]|uniref:Zn(2)-C6 fungal-type domain-containing protein n=1 Tax=Gnomoniopsis smithogilvyi TaxID=1191159 RepID=A0A9W9CZI7_9PEZI|nr:hypothetical protein N0V93_003052 [Gnomoniopsis smithogilvyi]
MSEPIQITSTFPKTRPIVQPRPGAYQAPSPRFNKACDSCHISKVRCVLDPKSPIGTCKRCSKNGTSCIFSPVGPRRRPVRTKNDRIAELERRVKDMQLKLEKQVDRRSGTLENAFQNGASNLESASSEEACNPRPTSPSAADVGDTESSEDPPSLVLNTGPKSTEKSNASVNPPKNDVVVVEGLSGKHGEGYDTSRIASSVPTSASTTAESISTRKDRDIIDRGLITKREADRLIHEFRSALSGKFLGICLPSTTSNAQLRRSRPAFWLSILCAASAGSPEFFHLAPALFRELKAILDTHIISGGEPNLDALQALTSWAIFHNDPVFPLGEHAVEMYGIAVQMAVNMAEVSKLHSLPADAPIRDEDVSEVDIQLSRELLHWYWASFAIAFKKRKPRMIRQTHLVDASLRILQTTPNQSDARLIQYIKLVQIATDAVLALQHGHTQQVDGLSAEERDGILKSFEKKRKQWLVDCPFHLVNGKARAKEIKQPKADLLTVICIMLQNH